MKTLKLIFLLLLLFTVSNGQITKSYPTHNRIAYIPASNRVAIYDRTYTPYPFSTATTLFTVGSRSNITTGNEHLTAAEFFIQPDTTGSTSKWFQGVNSQVYGQGSSTSPNLFGFRSQVFTNGMTGTTGANLYGVYSNVDVGIPVTSAYGGYFQAIHGSSQANGAVLLVGIQSTVGGGHNGDLTEAISGRFDYSSSSSSPLSTTTTVRGIQLRSTFNANTAVTTYRGLEIGNVNWAGANTGTVGTTYAIYIDSTLGTYGTTNWNIYSLSTAPNYFAGKNTFDTTNTAGGTTGNQTINKPSFSVNFAAGASSLVVTNSFITTSSYVLCTVQTNDATALLKNATPAAGSVTIRLNANATAETRVACMVVN